MGRWYEPRLVLALPKPENEMADALVNLFEWCKRERERLQMQREMLREKRRTVDARGAAIPLIGAAWHDASVMLKMVRLAEHLRWAAFSAPRLRN